MRLLGKLTQEPLAKETTRMTTNYSPLANKTMPQAYGQSQSSIAGRAVLMALVSQLDDSYTVRLSTKKLSELSRYSMPTVDRALTELEELGEIEAHRQRGCKDNSYIVLIGR